MNRNLFAACAVALLFHATACSGAGDAVIGSGPLGIRGWRNDWTGCYPEASPVTAWDIEKGINVLWRVPTTRYGNAMPLVVGERLFITIDPATLVCMDKMTGRVLWTSLGASPDSYASLFNVDTNAVLWSKRGLSYGANAGTAFPTPVTDGKRIWCKASSTAYCYDVADGKLLWSAPLHVAGGDHPHGVGSPLLVSNVLVCVGGSTEYWDKNSTNKIPAGVIPKNPQTGRFAHWMVGLDAATGKILWDVGPLNSGGYGALLSPVPVIVNYGQRQHVFVMTPEGQVVRPEDGKLVIPLAGARSGCTSPTPLGNRVLFPGALIEFSMDGPDKLIARKVCGVTAPGNLGGPAYNNGMVYSGYRQGGAEPPVEAAPTNQPALTATRLYGVCEAATGRVIHMGVRGPAIFDSPEWPTPAAAGKYLFFPTLNSIDVADISVGRPWPMAMNVNERSHTGPVFDGERMYLRTYDAIACIARKGEDGARYEREVNARTVIRAFPREIGKRELIQVTPVDDPTAWADGPVSTYTSGKAPEKWIFAGPFPRAEGKDALESLGGCAKAQPPAGEQVTFEGTTRAFAAVDARHITPKGLDTDGPTGKDRKGQSFFFAWLLAGKAEYVTLSPRKPGVRVWVGGLEVAEHHVLKILKGGYPVLMRIALPEDYVEAPMAVDMVFSASEDPAETRKKDTALVRDGRDYLKQVIEALPGTVEARQAASLLKAIDQP